MFRSRLIVVALLTSFIAVAAPTPSDAIVGPAPEVFFSQLRGISDDGRFVVISGSTLQWQRFDRLTGATVDIAEPRLMSGDLAWSIDAAPVVNPPPPSWYGVDTGARVSIPMPAGAAHPVIRPVDLSADGRLVLAGLADSTTDYLRQAFVADRVTGEAMMSPIAEAFPIALSPNGRFALLRGPCVPDTGIACERVYRWDITAGSAPLVTSGTLERAFVVGDDGAMLVSRGDAFTGADLRITRREATGVEHQIWDPATVPTGEPLQFASDARTVIAIVSGTREVIAIDAASAARSSLGIAPQSMQVKLSKNGRVVGLAAQPANTLPHTGELTVVAVPGAPVTPRLSAGEVFTLPVAGVRGVSAGAGAVVLNVTVTNPLVSGFVTVWPCGAPMPTASNVNFVAGQTVANAVVSQVGVGGAVCVSSNTGVDLVVDVQGYFTGAAYTGITPDRFLDTRNGEEDAVPNVAAGVVVSLPVAGVRGVSAGAGAVVLNVTVTNPLVSGFVTVWPCGAPMPTASNVNFVAGQTVANAVVSQVGVGGAVCVSSNTGVDLVVDVQGYFTGAAYTGITPDRFLDTRNGEEDAVPNVAAGVVVSLPVAGVRGVSAGAGAVVLNVTVTNPLVSGFVTVWPCGAPMPTASNVNFVAGQTVANAVVSQVGVGGAVCVSSNTGVDLVVDVQGYFTGAAYTGITPDRFLDTRD